MNTDDIFEAMTDIDDKFIEAARPPYSSIEYVADGQPEIVMPAQRKPRWKSVVPAAACLAVLVTAGAVGVNYLRGHDIQTSTPAASSPELKEYWYPEEAKYVVDENIDRFGFGYQSADIGLSMYDASADYAKNYDELAAKSDLIVMGTFIDTIHQTSDSEKVLCVGDDHLMMSYNWLRVESVLKGDVEEGSVLTIGQNSTINSANGNDDRYNVYTCDQLSPMLKGDKWIYFLKMEENGAFSPVNGPQGRYPLPNSANTLITSDGVTANVDRFGTYKNAAPAREEIYSKLMNLLVGNIQDIQEIKIPSEGAEAFAMDEFPDVEFKASLAGVTVNGDTRDIKGEGYFAIGGQLENLFLVDLNGDRRRELCATVATSSGSRSVQVYDYESGASYSMSGKREYWLTVEDGVLKVSDSLRENVGIVSVTSVQPLTLDLMRLTIPNVKFWEEPLDEQMFSLEEFSDMNFRASEDGVTVDEIDTGYVRHVIFGGVKLEKLYLADLNGDYKRELCAEISDNDGNSSIMVYDIANDNTLTLQGDTKNAYSLENEDVFLYAVKGNDRSLLSLEFDTMPKAAIMDYAKVSLDHQGIFTLPDFENCKFWINTDFGHMTFDIDYSFAGSGNSGALANEVYLCDIDGDGKREIIVNTPERYGINGGVIVFDIMEDGNFGSAEYIEDGCGIIEANGRLLYKSQGGVKDFDYSESELMPEYPKNYFDVTLYYDHTEKFGVIYHDSETDSNVEVFPWLSAYNIEIKNRTLKIDYNGQMMFDSGHKLGKLFRIYDCDNSAVIYVFTNKNDGTVGALKMSSQPARLYRFEEKITLKPTTHALLIVHEDGTEEPFSFPDDRAQPVQ